MKFLCVYYYSPFRFYYRVGCSRNIRYLHRVLHKYRLTIDNNNDAEDLFFSPGKYKILKYNMSSIYNIIRNSKYYILYYRTEIRNELYVFTIYYIIKKKNVHRHIEHYMMLSIYTCVRDIFFFCWWILENSQE